MFDKIEKLLEELQQAPISEVLGVVDAAGASGAKMKDKVWFLRFALDSWKLVGGRLQNRQLTIRKPVNHEELKVIMKQIAPLGTILVQARITEENSFGSPQGLLVNIITQDIIDPELQLRIEGLKKPVIFEDTKLGVFTLDRRIGWFETEVFWEASKIKLHLKPSIGGDVRECLTTAHALWDLQSVWRKRVTDLAIAELLDLKNEAWLQEDESLLTAEIFRTTMQLESISTSPDGSFDFWYSDGGLFEGHAIRVAGNLSEGPVSADIEG
jgi:hypothetical protein